ncbi:MAG: 5-formyltetrahydrofolate cyclo-ligase [Clostridiales bacterium]|nr:5-formyltetrahydrofolate cyclo-ligase [Clostridiales bacterium]
MVASVIFDHKDLTSAKKDLRRQMKVQRAALLAEQKELWDRQIYDNVCSLDLVSKSRIVYCYLSFGSEIDTSGLVRTFLDSSKTVAVPRVTGREIHFYQIGALSDVSPGYRGILEPVETCPPAENPDALVILPGLAFTRAGDRLGYGGGYYDRFLAGEPDHPTLALAYPFQILDSSPREADDRRADWIMTPDELIDAGKEEAADKLSSE